MSKIEGRNQIIKNEDENEGPIRVAIYARTSSTKQRFGHSLNEQVRLSIERCNLLNWDVYFIFRDEAESGKNPDRPMFRSMLKTAEGGMIDVVMFWKLDRFSRSLMHAVQLESKLRSNGVALYSVTEQIDTTTAAGRFNFRNIASAAEFERDLIKQRTKMGIRALASEYKWPNNSPPLGYVTAEDQTLKIDDDADLVREIFKTYIDFKSMPDVADELNKKGIKTSSDNSWNPRAVGDILRNKLYTGHYEMGEVSEQIDEYQIIDQKLFDRVTKIRLRFRSGAKKKRMPKDRKRRKIEYIQSKYADYLNIRPTKTSH